jgi:glutaredoxin
VLSPDAPPNARGRIEGFLFVICGSDVAGGRLCCTLGATMRRSLCLLACAYALGCGAANNQGTTAAPTNATEVDVSNLTPRERADYNELTHSLLAPCPELPLSIAECVERRAACNACLPAAHFLHDSISRGHTAPRTESAFRLRFDPKGVSTIDTTGSPVKGEANAPVTVVEWADFECPFCARATSFIDELIKARPARVKLVFKYYPLSGHPHGELTARAAAAADLQGKFWPMHDQMFSSQSAGLDEVRIRAIAKEIGLDLQKFEADWVSDEVKLKVDRDRAEADRLGLQGTPFIWVNGRRVDSKYFNLEEDLPAWLDLEWTLQTSAKSKP